MLTAIKRVPIARNNRNRPRPSYCNAARPIPETAKNALQPKALAIFPRADAIGAAMAEARTATANAHARRSAKITLYASELSSTDAVEELLEACKGLDSSLA